MGRGGLEGPSTLLSPSPSSAYSTLAGSSPLDHHTSAPAALAPGPVGPPLEPTKFLNQVTDVNGQLVRPDILARIDKGFFLYDQDWTCYRRNYFSIACAYTLRPSQPTVPLYVARADVLGGRARIIAFAMSISAAVDEPAGKSVDLIQHTPKRDKGPQARPERIHLNPHPEGALGLFPGGMATGRIHHEYDAVTGSGGGGGGAASASAASELPTAAQFDRIQFKSATANNGKRRAAQQYYRLVVDLYADVGGSLGVGMGGEGRWVKVAERASAPVVVRGRSPGHYQDEQRRGSTSSSMGPRGPGPADYMGGGGSGGSGGGARLDIYSGGGMHHHHHAGGGTGGGLGEPLSLLGGPSAMLSRRGGIGGGGSSSMGSYHASMGVSGGGVSALSPWCEPTLPSTELSWSRRTSGTSSSSLSSEDDGDFSMVGKLEQRARYQPYPSPPLEPLPGGTCSPANLPLHVVKQEEGMDMVWSQPFSATSFSPGPTGPLAGLAIRDQLRSCMGDSSLGPSSVYQSHYQQQQQQPQGHDMDIDHQQQQQYEQHQHEHEHQQAWSEAHTELYTL